MKVVPTAALDPLNVPRLVQMDINRKAAPDNKLAEIMSVSLLPLTNGDWTYRVGVTPVAALPGAHSLEVTSQWAGAKDRRAKVRQLQITLAKPELQDLHDYLGAYLRMAP